MTVQRTLISHEHLVDCVAYSPDGKTVATGTRDGTVRSWDAMTGEPVGQALVHSGEVLSMAFSPGAPGLLATGSSDKSVRIWDMATGKLDRSTDPAARPRQLSPVQPGRP